MHLQNGIENALEKGFLEKIHEKLCTKGHFNFKPPFAHAQKGFLKKIHEKLRTKGAFPIGHYRLKCVLLLDAKRLILHSW